MNFDFTIPVHPISEDFAECVKPDKHNQTDLLIAIDVDLPPLLTAVEIVSLNSLKNSLFNCIHLLHPHDHKASHQCCVPLLKNSFLNNLARKEVLVEVILWPVFVQVDVDIHFGTLCDFCGC